MQVDQYKMNNMTRNTLLEDLLSAWEDTYKKGQLTLWIFLALQDESKYVDQIRQFVEENSEGTISCEEQSLYRALRKYEHVGVVAFENRRGNKGPDRKYYYLTPLGHELFDRFVGRNINLFFTDRIRTLLKL